MLIDIFRYYVNLLVERESYINTLTSIDDKVNYYERDCSEYYDAEDSVKQSRKLRQFMKACVHEVEVDILKTTKMFRETFSESTTDELEEFVSNMEEEKEKLEIENISCNDELKSYIEKYDTFIPEVRAKIDYKTKILKR